MAKIGFFDSGFGGLSVMREVVARLPQYDYVYFGDSANTPYGSRPADEVYEFTRRAVAFLFAEGCYLVVLACNTASSGALRRIQQEYLPLHGPNKRVLGVIIPAAEAAIETTRTGRIGVIATELTVASKRFEVELMKLKPELQVFQQSCPLLVPLIEAGQQGSKVVEAALRTYLTPLLQRGIDTLILGCTHYSLIKEQIAAIIGPQVRIIDEGPVIADKLATYLARHPELEQWLAKNGQHDFFCSDKRAFDTLASEFYGSPVRSVEIVL